MNGDSTTGPRSDSSSQATLITVGQLAKMLQTSVRTVWRLRSAGQMIEPIKIGGNTRWRLDQVRDWIRDGCPPPTQRDN
jgi:predicted DNA-binding transcriptional regulator AlpA